MKKKLLVSLLILSMVLALLPLGAGAEGIVGKQWNTVSAGPFHTAAIDANGGLWTWGCNAVGQLGNGGTGDEIDDFGITYQSAPVKVMDNVVSVSSNKAIGGMGTNLCGATAAIKSDGSLWVWGDAGLIGTGGKGNTSVEYYGMKHEIQNVPIKLMDGVASVSMGGEINLALKTDGSLLYWTRGTNPEKILDNVISMSAGTYCIAAIKSDNSLWMWDGYDSLGEESINMEKVMDGVAAVTACFGRSTSFQPSMYAAIKADGSLWMWEALTRLTLCLF